MHSLYLRDFGIHDVGICLNYNKIKNMKISLLIPLYETIHNDVYIKPNSKLYENPPYHRLALSSSLTLLFLDRRINPHLDRQISVFMHDTHMRDAHIYSNI